MRIYTTKTGSNWTRDQQGGFSELLACVSRLHFVLGVKILLHREEEDHGECPLPAVTLPPTPVPRCPNDSSTDDRARLDAAVGPTESHP